MIVEIVVIFTPVNSEASETLLHFSNNSPVYAEYTYTFFDSPLEPPKAIL